MDHSSNPNTAPPGVSDWHNEPRVAGPEMVELADTILEDKDSPPVLLIAAFMAVWTDDDSLLRELVEEYAAAS